MMNKASAPALLAGGIVLMIIGLNAMNSFSTGVSKVFTGAPTAKAVWMRLGGLVAAAAGLGTLTFRTAS
jgi:hypothetical protein